MAVVFIPALLRELSGGAEKVEVDGKTVREVIEALDHLYPGMSARLCEAGQLRPNLSVVVNGLVAPHRLRQRLDAASEVHFLAVISGG